MYALKIDEVDGEPVIRLNKNSREYLKMVEMFLAWQKEAKRWHDGEITKEEYDQWRYSYPKFDTSGMFHKIEPSDELSDLLTDELMNALSAKGGKRYRK